MDVNGYVDISVIANFKRIANMTADRNYIKSCLANSQKVEVVNDKIGALDPSIAKRFVVAGLEGEVAPNSILQCVQKILPGFEIRSFFWAKNRFFKNAPRTAPRNALKRP